MNILKNCIWSIVSILLFFTLFASAAADQKKDSSLNLKIKPDLRIVSVKAERTGLDADGGHRVQVKVTVINSAATRICAGPFLVRLEKRSLPADYINHGQESVARLCADPSRAKAATVTLSFADTVPSGVRRVWRATSDATAQVSEANESNNSGESEIYVAKTYCPGVDLVLTKVEIVRNASGNVFMRAYGRNRCAGSCASAVEAVFETEAPDEAELSVSQTMGLSTIGLQEYESGMVGVYSRPDRSVNYLVRIALESASCSDINPTNNYSRITFTAGETNKTVNCH
ncbi:MAG: hypothetical protein ABII93_00790 [Chrysiogenia bacterium]